MPEAILVEVEKGFVGPKQLLESFIAQFFEQISASRLGKGLSQLTFEGFFALGEGVVFGLPGREGDLSGLVKPVGQLGAYALQLVDVRGILRVLCERLEGLLLPERVQ